MADKRSIKDILYDAYTRVISPDSYNAVNHRFNQKSRDQHMRASDDLDDRISGYKQAVDEYSRSYITMLTSILGWPNYCKFGQRQSWPNIFYLFTGYRTDFKGWWKLANFIIVPLVTTKSIIVSIFTFPRNLIKLVTEFLPLVAADLTQSLMNYVSKQGRRARGINRVLLVTAYLGLFITWLTAHAIHFIGRAVTSPINGVSEAFAEGKNLNGKNRGGNFIGLILAATSIGITVSVYAFLFPLIFTAASGVISFDISIKIMEALSNLPSLSSLGMVLLGPFLSPAFIATGLAAIPAMAALSAIGGLLATVITMPGALISKVYDKWLNAFREKTITHSAQRARPLSLVPAENTMPHTGTNHQVRKILENNPPLQGALPADNNPSFIPLSEDSSSEDDKKATEAIIKELIQEEDALAATDHPAARDGFIPLDESETSHVALSHS